MSHLRIALISGASRGLGLETARQLGERGYRLVMVARGKQRLESAAEEIRNSTGTEVLAIAADVTSASAVGALAEAVHASMGGIDVLVNNAGVFLGPKDFAQPDTASVLDADPDAILTTLAVNVIGPLRLAQTFVPTMRARNWGRIVNVSSGMGQLADMSGHWGGYRMSKTALNALTRILAAELQGTGIKVNSVCPGWCRTDMGSQAANRSASEGAKSIAWAALLPDDGPSGGFFRDGTSIAW